MRIAFIGSAWGTAQHRTQALERLGHTVSVVDPRALLGKSIWTSRWLYHTGGGGVGLLIDRAVIRSVGTSRPDIILVNQGEFLGWRLVRGLRDLGVPIINYLNDDPYGAASRRFRRFRQALPYYDLVAVVRDENVAEARAEGARHVVRIWMSADEVAHRRREISAQQRKRWASDVLFVGTWMPERGTFIAELARRGVPLAIWGDDWKKAPEWDAISKYWRGPGVYDDDSYAAVIQSAKVCLGLLSRANRDRYTTRSMEIPCLGGLLCAERTREHLALYEEGSEAIFWRDAEECATACMTLLKEDEKRATIAARGHERAWANGHLNERVLSALLAAAMAGHS